MAEQVVDRHREEAVHLRRVQRHREHPVGARGRDQVGHQPAADRDARRVLLVRARVRVVRDHGGDLRRGRPAGGVQHEQQLDQVVLHRRDQRLDDVDVALAAVLAQLHLDAVVAEPGDVRRREVDAEVGADLLGELDVGATGEDDDVAHAAPRGSGADQAALRLCAARSGADVRRRRDRGPRPGPHVRPLALRPEQAQELGRTAVRRCRTSAASGCRTRPPRRPSAPGRARPAPRRSRPRQHVQPLVALVGAQDRLGVGGTSAAIRCLNACSPPGLLLSGTIVWPPRVTGRPCTRGSSVCGAPTSSSNGTRCAAARGSSSSRVGLRPPDSSRDSVLTEMPVRSDSAARVRPPSWRRARSRGPTAAQDVVVAGRHPASIRWPGAVATW